MQPAHPVQPRCGRRTRGGSVHCKNFAMHGQTVCRMHGGKAPQALAKAEERMRALIDPAISSLAEQIAAGEFQATKYVLDWAGYKPTEKLQTEQQLTIRVVREDQPIIEITPQRYDLGNGRTHD